MMGRRCYACSSRDRGGKELSLVWLWPDAVTQLATIEFSAEA